MVMKPWSKTFAVKAFNPTKPVLSQVSTYEQTMNIIDSLGDELWQLMDEQNLLEDVNGNLFKVTITAFVETDK